MLSEVTMFRSVLFFLLLPFAALEDVSLLPAEGEAARYWPRWRGPSGQGLVDGSGYPDEWSDTKNVLWRVAVPGSGNSSPIVFGDRIFVSPRGTRDGNYRSSPTAGATEEFSGRRRRTIRSPDLDRG